MLPIKSLSPALSGGCFMKKNRKESNFIQIKISKNLAYFQTYFQIIGY